jgi:hypothetical protein
MDVLAWLKSLVLWFKNPIKVMVCLALCSAIAIFVPARLQVWAQTYEWTVMHRVLEFGVLIFSLTWVALSGLQSLYARFAIWIKLRRLPKDQRPILKYYVDNDLGTHTWYASDLAARSLEYEGILIPLPRLIVNAVNDPHLDGYLNYRLKPWIKRYLTKHPNFVT